MQAFEVVHQRGQKGQVSWAFVGTKSRSAGGGAGRYSFVAGRSQLTMDHASLSMWSTVFTFHIGTSNI